MSQGFESTLREDKGNVELGTMAPTRIEIRRRQSFELSIHGARNTASSCHGSAPLV